MRSFRGSVSKPKPVCTNIKSHNKKEVANVKLPIKNTTSRPLPSFTSEKKHKRNTSRKVSWWPGCFGRTRAKGWSPGYSHPNLVVWVGVGGWNGCSSRARHGWGEAEPRPGRGRGGWHRLRPPHPPTGHGDWQKQHSTFARSRPTRVASNWETELYGNIWFYSFCHVCV